MELGSGVRVGSFEILAPLGSGGMGDVYRARDVKLGREVAIKVLQQHLADRRDYLLRFQREARSASALNHPNIVTIYEIDEVDGAPFIAMELIEGVRLRDFLTHEPLPTRKLLDIATQLADGLAAAHERGIVHRDIKPENVMIAKDGLVKILDFGLAQLIRDARDEESTSEILTGDKGGRLLGTTVYMSPEQARGSRTDFHSDQFSFGSLLYEMATGRRLFARDSVVLTLTAIERDEPPLLTSVNAEVPEGLSRIVERCLAKDPNERYASTRDLARDLRTMRDRPHEMSARTPVRSPRRKRTLIGAGAAAIIIAASMLALSSYQRKPATAPLPTQKFLAVLPFRDASGVPNERLFSEGFADAVSARLGRLSGIQVIPPAAATTLVAKSATPQRIAQELGATLLLHATVQRAGERLRVSYAIIEPARGAEVGGNIVEGATGDIWNLQDEVAKAVAHDLDLDGRQPATQHAGLETTAEQSLYLRALADLDRSDDEAAIDTAIARLREVVETASDSPLVHAALGRAYLEKYYVTHDKQWTERAVRACDRARSLDPNSADVLLTLGDVRRVTGEYEQAIQAFKRALAVQPNLCDAAIGLGRAYQAIQQPVAAEQAFRRAIDLRPIWWAPHNNLGILYLARGRYDDAAREFRSVIRLNPHSPWGHSNLGNVYVVKGQLENAVAAFHAAISLRPDDAAYSNLGYCYYFLGDYEKAAEYNRKAAQLRPAMATYWANLADACAWTATCRNEAQRHYKHAIELLRHDIGINPKNARARATLAVCLAKTGAAEEARQQMKSALELDPDNPTRMYQAARVANLSGRRAEAAEWIRRALAAGYQRFEVERDPEFAELRTRETKGTS